jgi:hypothetical protein
MALANTADAEPATNARLPMFGISKLLRGVLAAGLGLSPRSWLLSRIPRDR